MSGYGVFARYYDLLTQNVEYARRAAVFDSLLRAQRDGGGLLLDLCCGTGSLSVELARLGYDVIGADASAEMLSQAMQKAAGFQPPVLFLQQDAKDLDLYGTIDACVCALDSVNHLDKDTLQQALAKVSLFMNPGGVFAFDVNTLYKHREVMACNAFVYDLEEVYCAWQNEYCPRDHSVGISLDFFVPQNGGYRRYREQFREYYYSEDFLMALLQDNGFTLSGIYREDGAAYDKAENTQRLVCVAKKNKG